MTRVCSYHGPHVLDRGCSECRGETPPGSASIAVGDGLVLPNPAALTGPGTDLSADIVGLLTERERRLRNGNG